MSWTDDDVRAGLEGAEPVEAAEAVAAAAGYPGELLSAAGRDWAETHGVPPSELVEAALRRVRDLCAEETDEATLTQLRDLRFRLGDALAP